MAENSKIEWTDATFNPWIGCTKVSDGCKSCYAETLMDHRYGKVKWGPQGTRVRTSDAYWRKPLQWNKHPWYECSGCGWRGQVKGDLYGGTFGGCQTCRNGLLRPTRCRVFCASLADVFEDRNGQDALTLWRAQLWHLIEQTPNLDWLLLTKRPENVLAMTPQHWRPLPDNVWIGTSVEDQQRADERIPHLLNVPARVRFLSCEPLLGPVDLLNIRYGDYRIDVLKGYYRTGKSTSVRDGTPFCFGMSSLRTIDWVIVGGESGHDARPMHPNWARSIRNQCVAAQVPYFFKQWGEWMPTARNGHWKQEYMVPGKPNRWVAPDGQFCTDLGPLGMAPVAKVGKKAAGRLLDGREWNEFPVQETTPDAV